jgi:(1->4)-alpha-D-glucan 1-alpha-D-glucosylmutase
MAAPSSTYRLQFGAGLTFTDAAGLTDYLAALGAGALYASPLLAATPGSTHGYDVVDTTRVSAELGGESKRLELVSALRAQGLGLVLDIVPNHMGVEVPAANPWWWDLLTNGESSQHARFFDVDWAAGPILLPVLDADEDAALDQLTVADGQLHYYEHTFPLAPETDGGSPREVHDRQHYRLVSWRRGPSDLTYRRFFDVSTLAAVRVEASEVFAATHREILRWVAAGEVDGLRVDHPDGLSDPGGYLHNLRAAAPNSWLVVEKILGTTAVATSVTAERSLPKSESLPASWPVDGSTGYEALREICGVFVDPEGEQPFSELASQWTGSTASLHQVESECRRLVAAQLLVAEVRRIARLMPHVAPESAQTAIGELATAELATAELATAELLCSFPVYRSYLPAGREVLDFAVDAASAARPDLAGVFEAVRSEMVEHPAGELAIRIQQTSGMVMAKGVEDTAFYRWNRFVALNEVGGDPSRFGVSPDELHAASAARAADWPRMMTTLSTHDTKRSEDVRARLAVLSELPTQWVAALPRWAARHPLPEPSLELLAWQSLLGAWPISADRLRDYLGKASKEAKLVTSHLAPVAEADAAIAAWPAQVLADASQVRELEDFLALMLEGGWSNSLGQKLLQLAGPGVPDVYQGTELFEYSLVDPDNRRPVDFAVRRTLLERLDSGWLPPVDASGAAKLLLVSRILRLRRESPELFIGYRPLQVSGPAAAHAVAFARSENLVAVATRLPIGLAGRADSNGDSWGDTVLALPAGAGEWTDVLTGTPVADALAPGTPRLANVLARYPVALLVRR